MEEKMRELHESARYSFNDGLLHIPPVVAGVYCVYDVRDILLYVGMAGEGLYQEKIDRILAKRRISGLRDRLKSHASGARSGDRFNIYIADLFVLPTLGRRQINDISRRTLSMDSLVKEYIRNNLYYRFVVTENTIVRNLENSIQRDGLFGNIPTINGKSPT